MPSLKRSDRDADDEEWSVCTSVPLRILSLIMMIAGPLLLVYINVRCEKNQCVLLQFPLVLPTHLSAYFSFFSCFAVAFFLALMFGVSSAYAIERKKRLKNMNTNFTITLRCLFCLSMLMVVVAYLKPSYIKLLRSEHLRLLCTTIMFSLIFSLILALLIRFDFIRGERDRCFTMGFFHGYNTKVKLAGVNLKYFFYVHAGYVAWALVDLLIFIGFVLERPITAPLCFVFTTQLIMIVHTLLYEKILHNRPFMHTEGLGFFWLLRVILFMPFLFSLPVLYTSVTEITFSKPAMLANCALFMFGFVIYISSLHQKENYALGQVSRSWRSILTNTGKRILIGGYWGTVQKPHYLGYMLIWLSWIIVCGFSAVSVLVLVTVYGTILFWLYQTNSFHKARYGSAWNRYVANVPYRIIPLVY